MHTYFFKYLYDEENEKLSYTGREVIIAKNSEEALKQLDKLHKDNQLRGFNQRNFKRIN